MAEAFAPATPAASAPTGRRRGRGIIYNDKLQIRIDFQYDPEQIESEKTLNWHTSEILGVTMPLLTYGGGDFRIRRFSILLDAHASPHPDGHVGNEIYWLELLSVPWDVDGVPTVKPSSSAFATQDSVKTALAPGRVAGVPPVVKIAYGGRVERGVLRNLRITETFHGSTPKASGGNFPTRATAEFEFIVIEDSRLLVHWTRYAP